MCSNVSPSEKADGTTDAATLAAEYEEFLVDIEDQPLPSYRVEELRARIEEVRGALAVDGVASAGQLQQLLRTVTEALADVRAARVVPAPPERDLSAAVPGATDTGAAYEVTEAERAKTTNVLVNLLFTVVETPTRADRRAEHDDEWTGTDDERTRVDDGERTRADDDEWTEADDGETSERQESEDAATHETLGVEGYPGPE